MPLNPSASHYQDPTFRADDDALVAIKKYIQSVVEGLVTVPQSGSFAIPPFDTQEFTYVAGGAADDDDVQTITYKKDGVVVATQTFTYWTTTNNVASITLT